MKGRHLTAAMLGESVAARLRANVEIDANGCWRWTKGTNDFGYGVIRVTNAHGDWGERCHRASYALNVGEIPAGMSVCHHCDNPPCINPAHLFLGTASDNALDMCRKGRRTTKPPVGEKSNLAKLTEAQVREACDMVRGGMSRAAVGRHFGLTVGAISSITLGKTWAHLRANAGIPKSTRGVKKERPLVDSYC